MSRPRRSTIPLCLAVLPLALASGCPKPPGVVQNGVAPIHGIGAFSKVSPILYRGDQPADKEAFAELKRRGVKTVISLRILDCDRDDMAGLGMRYLHISAKPGHPEDEDVVAFLQAVLDPVNQPVFVHCRQGVDRTGVMVAAYRIVTQGWSNRRALQEMKDLGFHRGFMTLEEYVEHLDPARLRRRMAETPPPQIETVP